MPGGLKTLKNSNFSVKIPSRVVSSNITAKKTQDFSQHFAKKIPNDLENSQNWQLCNEVNVLQNVKQQDLLSLEMAQYEATLCGLQTQVSDLETIVQEKEKKVNDLENKVEDINHDRKVAEQVWVVSTISL